MKSGQWVAVVAAVLLIGLANRVGAESFVIGVENIEYFPQYTYIDGEYGGFGRELLDAFATSRGYTFRYLGLPVKRLYVEYLTGDQLDLIYPDNELWHMEDKKGLTIHYSAPVIPFTDGAMVLPERKGKPMDVNFRIGTIRGFTPTAFVDLLGVGPLEITEASNFSGLLRMVLAKRVDGAYINIAVAHHFLDNVLKEPTALRFDESLPHVNGHYHLSSRKHPKIINEFNIFLEEEKGAVDKIKEAFKVGQKAE